MGLRLRLRSSFDTSTLTGQAHVIAVAMQRYGLIVADNGSNWYFQGAPSPGWNDDDLNQLKSISGDQFEVVEVTAFDGAADLELDPAVLLADPRLGRRPAGAAVGLVLVAGRGRFGHPPQEASTACACGLPTGEAYQMVRCSQLPGPRRGGLHTISAIWCGPSLA